MLYVGLSTTVPQPFVQLAIIKANFTTGKAGGWLSRILPIPTVRSHLIAFAELVLALNYQSVRIFYGANIFSPELP